MKTKKKILTKLITPTLIVLATLIFAASTYYVYYFGGMGAEQLFYTLTEPLTGTGDDVIINIVNGILKPFLIMLIPITYLYMTSRNGFRYKKKSEKAKKVAFIMSIVLFVTSIIYSFYQIKIFDFIQYQINKGTFIEENYLQPKDVTITFPEEKRNLIILYVESMMEE